MTAKTWNIDTTHSTISFTVRHMVFAKVRGRFDDWRGALAFDPENLSASSVEVEIDAASIDTGVADRDNHLRSADFFDAEKHPKLYFKSTSVEAAGGDRFRVHGELSIHGVTREVVLDSEYNGQGKDPWGNQRAAFSATTSVDRRDFGLKWNQALEAGGVLVGEKVEISLEVQAVDATQTEAA